MRWQTLKGCHHHTNIYITDKLEKVLKEEYNLKCSICLRYFMSHDTAHYIFSYFIWQNGLLNAVMEEVQKFLIL